MRDWCGRISLSVVVVGLYFDGSCLVGLVVCRLPFAFFVQKYLVGIYHRFLIKKSIETYF